MKIFDKITSIHSPPKSTPLDFSFLSEQLNGMIGKTLNPQPAFQTLHKDEHVALGHGDEHVCICIDISPSMSFVDFNPTRLEAVKVAASQFLKKLALHSPQTFISIISYSGKASIHSPPKPVNRSFKELCSIIEELQPIGIGTNLSAPLQAAHHQFNKYHGSYRVDKRIILLTDGDDNSWSQPVDTANNIKRSGIQLDIIGIGSGDSFDEQTLKSMASLKNGELRYWFIDSVDALVKQFQCLAKR